MTRKRSPHEPIAASPFAELKALKAKMEADEAARKAAEAVKKEAAKARGELESRPRTVSTGRSPTVPANSPRAAGTKPDAPNAPNAPNAPGVWRPDMDKRLFEVAMAGVVPLTDAPTRVSSRDPAAPDRRKASIEARLRRAHAEGGTGLQVAWHPDGTVTAVRAGRTFALEALGRFASPEESCDLHRLDTVEAVARSVEFVRTRRARGMRVVCVIHGRGKRSPDGVSVLRDAVVEALRKPPASNDIDAFATAPDACGGAGALLVSLRT